MATDAMIHAAGLRAEQPMLVLSGRCPAAAAACLRCPSPSPAGMVGVGRPMVDLFGAHRDVVHDRAVPRIEVINQPLITLMQIPTIQ